MFWSTSVTKTYMVILPLPRKGSWSAGACASISKSSSDIRFHLSESFHPRRSPPGKITDVSQNRYSPRRWQGNGTCARRAADLIIIKSKPTTNGWDLFESWICFKSDLIVQESSNLTFKTINPYYLCQAVHKSGFGLKILAGLGSNMNLWFSNCHVTWIKVSYYQIWSRNEAIDN